MTAEAKQNPRINSLHRFCHDRLFKTRNENVKMSPQWLLVLKNPGENQIIWNRNSAIFIPNCKLASRQALNSAMSLPKELDLQFIYPLHFGERCKNLWNYLLIFFSIQNLEREGGRGTKLARTSLMWASLVLIEWIMRHVGWWACQAMFVCNSN